MPLVAIDQFISKQELAHQKILWELMITVRDAIPHVEERFSWSIPYFYYLKKPLCYLNVTKNGLVYMGINNTVPLAEVYAQLTGEGKVIRQLHFPNLQSIDIGVIKAILFEVCDIIEEKLRS